jgi:hypothetical protein
MWTISAMQDSTVIVSTIGQHIPQRVLREPIAVAGVSIRKAVDATAYRH